MSEIYKKIGNYRVIKNGEHFGLSDSEGNTFLPEEYDNIFFYGEGFIITKNSKSGYIKFRENLTPQDESEICVPIPEPFIEQFLPCIYDRIEPTRNGLVLYSMTSDVYKSEKRIWFDYESGKLYENLYFMRNHREYDEFLDMNKGSQMPHLKKAGEDFYVYVPFDLSVSILYEIPIYSSIARYFVCSEELPEEEAERKGWGYEYFFMIVLPDSYTFTEPKLDIKEIFNDFPKLISFWEKEAQKEKEHKEYMKGKKKNDKHKARNL